MAGMLLDTNVVSELARPEPEPAVVDFCTNVLDARLSVITLHELLHGARLVKAKRRFRQLLEWIEELRRQFDAYILPVDASIADRAASLRASASLVGRTLHIEDALIAATALEHGLQLATRNTTDFEATGVFLVNPWD